MERILRVGGLVVATWALATGPGQGQGPDKKDGPVGKDKPEPAPVIRLAPQQAGKAPRALGYRLLPDPLDLTPGNAALLWLRAAQAARVVRHKVTDKEYAWGGSEVKLADLPRKDVRAFLDRYKAALRLADQAARRSRCDWGREPLTIQSIHEGLPLDEIQGLRQLASLLQTRCRLELSEGRFDQAAYTLQTGFAMAQHLGGGDLVLEDLVAMAVGTIMLARVEEWVQVPGSPNLYWALTALPRPFIDVRHSVRSELGTLYRSFPALRELKKKTLGARQVEALVGQVFDSFSKVIGLEVPPWMRRLGSAGLTAKYYPDAKRHLVAQGRPAKEVEAMPALQVVLLYYLDRYDRTGDDILKWLSVPPWQGMGPLEKIERQLRAEPTTGNHFPLELLVPAITKAYAAQVRTDRYFAGLRGAEALRLYAAAHGGKVPAKWADLTDVPLPTDPVTGKGLDAFYRVADGKAVLDVPPAYGLPPRLGRRFELAGKKP
jgi:hypothetical protein